MIYLPYNYACTGILPTRYPSVAHTFSLICKIRIRPATRRQVPISTPPVSKRSLLGVNSNLVIQLKEEMEKIINIPTLLVIIFAHFAVFDKVRKNCTREKCFFGKICHFLDDFRDFCSISKANPRKYIRAKYGHYYHREN